MKLKLYTLGTVGLLGLAAYATIFEPEGGWNPEPPKVAAAPIDCNAEKATYAGYFLKLVRADAAAPANHWKFQADKPTVIVDNKACTKFHVYIPVTAGLDNAYHYLAYKTYNHNETGSHLIGPLEPKKFWEQRAKRLAKL